MARTTWGPLSTDEQNQIEFAPVGEPGVLAPGTTGGLLKRNADGTIGNSILSESGSVLTAAGRLVIGGGTVTASTPVLDLSQTWNLAGTTFTALKFNVTDSASASGSLLFDFEVGGVSKIYGSKVGNFYVSGGSVVFGSTLDTILSRSAAHTLDLRNGSNAQTWNVYGTYTDASNYRRIRTTMTTGGAATIAAEGLGAGASGNTLALISDGFTALTASGTTVSIGGTLNVGSGSTIYWSTRTILSSPADGHLFLRNNAASDGDIFIKFGVNTSAAAGIKRAASSTVLQARLNDDSAFATIQGKLRTDNAYVAGAVVGTGYVTITDSTGTAYRVPVLV